MDRWNSHICLVECKMVQPLWKAARQFLKILINCVNNTVIIWHSNFTPRNICKRNENICPHNVHSSIIHNSQKVETSHMSISGWTDKQNVAFPYERILFGYEEERSADTCGNHRSFENMMLSAGSETQKATFYVILFMWNVQNRRILRKNTDWWLPGPGGRRNGVWVLGW